MADEEAGQGNERLLGQAGRSTSSYGGLLGSFHGAVIDPLLAGLDENFDVEHKNASAEALKRWRTSSLVLNASRRFRYTSNLDKRPKMNANQRFRVGSLAIKALGRFKSMRHGDATAKVAKDAGFDLSSRALANMVENSQSSHLKQYGGVQGVAASLKTDLEKGIEGTPDDIAKRQAAYGTNTYPEKPMKGFLGFVWDAMQDVTLWILAFCAALSLAIGIPTEGWKEGWYDGGGIAFSVIIVVLVTAVSDYQQSLQFKALNDEKKKVFITVQRQGRRQKVSIFDLVVGDIIILSIGDIIPADGLFISGHSLLIDESSMTGESQPKQKDEEHPFLLSGTKVQDGGAVLLATGVGMNTEWGHLMATLSETGDDETPLQVRLSGVATLVGRLGLYVALLVFIVLMIRFLITVDYSHWSGDDTLKIVNFFAVAVTIIVVAVPEGLPLAVTLTLAFAMKRMMADKALVRKLAACETMGSATTICSDKTGTLTANKMTVVTTWLGGEIRSPGEVEQILEDNVREVVLESMFTNSSGDVDEHKQPDGSVNVNVMGTPTETAILNLGLEFGGNFKAVRERVQIVHVDPFNSKRKRMGVVVKLPGGGYRAHWKGAAEIVVGMCDKMVGPKGESLDINHEEIAEVIKGFADQALRTLSLAYKDLSPEEFPNGEWPANKPIPDSGLNLELIVGIKDPLRAGVQHAVALCHSAGIKLCKRLLQRGRCGCGAHTSSISLTHNVPVLQVRMVTGDNLNTAKAIARECGIYTDGEAIEGPTFRNLSPEAMRALIPNLQVMARSSPTDKHTLVKELRAMGEVVAVTGDGTNDAPALKEADIGLAMGIAGTEVAKESADIVVLDDNFATIVGVAKWGRSVYNNIQKFVQFQLTVNIVALVVNFVSACVTGTAPLTAVQLLWVNLIMDTLGALALATEPPQDSLMENAPIGRKGKLISAVMWRNIAAMAVYQLIILGLMQYMGKQLFGYTGADADARVKTVIFNTFVFCQVFNEFNARDMERLNVLKGLFRNTLFIGVIVVTVLFQWILVQYLGKFATTVPLTVKEWLLSIVIGFVSMPIAALAKLIPIGKKQHPSGASSAGTSGAEGANGYVEVPGEPPVRKNESEVVEDEEEP
eukprot:jgi/Mesen1/5755/ME000292S04848